MKVDELMIGDWVQDTCGNPIHIMEIVKNGINGVCKDGWCCDAYDDIKPIPIDEDILDRNGWKIADDMFVKQPYMLKKADKVWGVAIGLAYIAEIRYVHELQNIMRMTGYQGGFKV